MNFFNEDNFLHRFFLSAGGFIGLNLLWIITSIPLITVGASTTALYYCTLKLHKDKDISIWKCYWKSFRGNFFQSTVVWLGLVAAGICVWFEKSDCHHANSYVSDVHLCDMGDSSASYHYSIVYLSNNRII